MSREDMRLAWIQFAAAALPGAMCACLKPDPGKPDDPMWSHTKRAAKVADDMLREVLTREAEGWR